MEREWFTLDDFRSMLDRVAKLDEFRDALRMPPLSSASGEPYGEAQYEFALRKLGGIVDAMTPAERRNPAGIVDHGRRRRIAIGAGVLPSTVSELIRQFSGMAPMVRKMRRMGRKGLGGPESN